MQENPERTKELMTDTIEAYLNVLKENKNEKPIISEKGKVVLKCLQDNQDVVLMTDVGITIKLPVDQISVLGRVTQGLRLISLKENQSVATVSVVDKSEDSQSDSE